jgi:hypothetical protein
MNRVDVTDAGVALGRQQSGAKTLRPAAGMLKDMWTSYDCLAAGVFLLQTNSYHAGTAASCGMRQSTANRCGRRSPLRR